MFGIIPSCDAQTVRRYGTLTVTKAQYGKPGAQVDVTDKVRTLIRDNSLDSRVNSDTLGANPTPDADKALRLTYTYLEAKHTIVVKEGESLPRSVSATVLRSAFARRHPTSRVTEVLIGP